MIKASTLAQAVKDLAIEQPENQASCIYFTNDGQPCCIVGHGMARLGVDPQIFLNDPGLNDGTSVSSLPYTGAVHFEIDDADCMEFLASMQYWQDDGDNWAGAYDKSAHKLNRGGPVAE